MLIGVIVFALFVNVLAFTYHSTNPLVRQDGWRFIEISLVPWYDGTFDWRALWSDHHSQPVTALLFIANAEWFGLQMNVEALFSVLFSVVVALLIIRAIRRTVAPSSVGVYGTLAVLVAATVMSLTSIPVYVWSLVTKGFITSACALACIDAMDRRVGRPLRGGSVALVFAGLLVFVVLFGDTAKIFVAGCALVLAVNLSLTRDPRIWVWLAVLASTPVLYSLFMAALDLKTTYGLRLSSITAFADYPPEYLSFLGIAQLSAWLKLPLATRLFLPEDAVPFLALLTLFVYSLTLVLFFARGMSRKTILPGVFISVALGTAVGAAMFRFDPASHQPFSGREPRYYLLYSLGVVGVLWVWGYHLAQQQARLPHRVLAWTAAVLFLLSQAFSTATSWGAVPYYQRAVAQASAIMVANAAGDFPARPPRSITGASYPRGYKLGLKFLAEHKLNIFAEEP